MINQQRLIFHNTQKHYSIDTRTLYKSSQDIRAFIVIYPIQPIQAFPTNDELSVCPDHWICFQQCCTFIGISSNWHACCNISAVIPVAVTQTFLFYEIWDSEKCIEFPEAIEILPSVICVAWNSDNHIIEAMEFHLLWLNDALHTCLL